MIMFSNQGGKSHGENMKKVGLFAPFLRNIQKYKKIAKYKEKCKQRRIHFKRCNISLRRMICKADHEGVNSSEVGGSNLTYSRASWQVHESRAHDKTDVCHILLGKAALEDPGRI
ncbi:hypothetical protein AVEN_263757-1 [Araneus ventricosus]|uniref:Uncharacterized protein n=1 Tax=Araneus ventricosus TaxID=182803 RepID=A0A4Y2AU37_ARAVE|nr:hypothetical protein AVEN_263757-1 [Araneus ventricosus]